MSTVMVWDGYKYQPAPEQAIGGGWDDVQGPVGQAGGASALTFEAYSTTNYNMYLMRHDQNDTLYLEYQMPHSWDRTQVRPHIHIIPMANPAVSENIYFEGEYAWMQAGKAAPVAPWTAFNSTFTVTPGMGLTNRVLLLVQVQPPADPQESDILLLWVRRAGKNVLDTYTTGKAVGLAAANMAVVSIDCHFRKDKSGTEQEFPEA